MKSRLLMLAVLGVYFVSVPLSTTFGAADCLSAPVTRLATGMRGTVTSNGGTPAPVRVRQDPGTSGKVLGNIQGNETFAVINGPTCQDGLWWWQIAAEGNLSGWIAEGTAQNYFVQPLDEFSERFGSGRAFDVGWSPDGNTLVIQSSWGIWLYAYDGKTLTRTAHFPNFQSLTWSPDQSQVVRKAISGIADLASAPDGKRITYLETSERASDFAWSPDGRLLAGFAGNGSIRLWNIQTGKPLRDLTPKEGFSTTFAWNPDSQGIAIGGRIRAKNEQSGDTGFIEIWNAQTGSFIHAFVPSKSDYALRQLDNGQAELPPVQHIQWGPDGKTLTVLHAGVNFAGEVFTWNIESNSTKPIETGLEGGSQNGTKFFLLSPDGNHVAISDFDVSPDGDGGYVSDVTIKPSQGGSPFAAANASIFAMAWRPDGTLLALVDSTGMITLLDGTTANQALQTADFAEMPNPGWSADGTQLRSLSIFQEFVNIKDLRNSGPSRHVIFKGVPSQRVPYAPYALSPDGNRLARAMSDTIIMVFNTDTGDPGVTLKAESASQPPTDWIGNISWTLNGRNIFALGNENYLVWDAQSGEIVQEFKAPIGLSNIQLSTHLERFASWGFDYKQKLSILNIGDAHTGKTLAQCQVQPDDKTIRVAIWSRDDTQLITAGDSGKIRVWDGNTCSLQKTFEGTESEIQTLALSPDGRKLASAGNDQVVRLWDLASGNLLRVLAGNHETIDDLGWKPDGSALLSSTGTMIIVWSIK